MIWKHYYCDVSRMADCVISCLPATSTARGATTPTLRFVDSFCLFEYGEVVFQL